MSPTGRWTTLVPLLFILVVAAVKEIIEDLVRQPFDIICLFSCSTLSKDPSFCEKTWLVFKKKNIKTFITQSITKYFQISLMARIYTVCTYYNTFSKYKKTIHKLLKAKFAFGLKQPLHPCYQSGSSMNAGSMDRTTLGMCSRVCCTQIVPNSVLCSVCKISHFYSCVLLLYSRTKCR